MHGCSLCDQLFLKLDGQYSQLRSRSKSSSYGNAAFQSYASTALLHRPIDLTSVLRVLLTPPASEGRCLDVVGGGPAIAQPVSPSASVVAGDPPSASQPPGSASVPPPQGAAAPEAPPAAPEDAPSAPPEVPAGPQQDPARPLQSQSIAPSDSLVAPAAAPDSDGGEPKDMHRLVLTVLIACSLAHCDSLIMVACLNFNVQSVG